MKLTKLLLTLGTIIFLTQIAYPQIGIGTTSPTANLHIAGNSSAAGDAPLKFNSSTVLTTPENGAVEFDGTNYFVTSGGSRYTLAKTLTASSTLNFPSLGTVAVSILTITVPGAQVNDPVVLGIPHASIIDNRLEFQAWVSSPNTVVVRVVNLSVGALDPPAGTFKVAVLKF